MPITKSEQEWLAAHVIPGCYYTHRSSYVNQAKATFNADLTVSFSNPDWITAWDWKKYSPQWYGEMSGFHWPDGSPMIIGVPHEGMEEYNPILWKIKSLQTKFKEKTLPKCKAKSLPFPKETCHV